MKSNNLISDIYHYVSHLGFIVHKMVKNNFNGIFKPSMPIIKSGSPKDTLQ